MAVSVNGDRVGQAVELQLAGGLGELAAQDQTTGSAADGGGGGAKPGANRGR